MATTPVLPKLVGERVKRREDPRLIQGRGTYVDDITLAGMQHLAFKRSDVAHGRIRSIDTSAAEAMDGVEAVFTGAADRRVPGADADRHAVPVAGPSRGRRRHGALRAASRWPSSSRAIATSRATPPTPSSCRYDPLPAVVDPELAMTGQADGHPPGLPEQPGGARSCRAARASTPIGETVDDTAIDEAFAEAEVVHLAADGEPAARADARWSRAASSRTTSRARAR